MKETFEGKTIVVTGGCGSVGSEIVKQLLQYNPETIRVFDSNEEGHFNLSQQISDKKIRHLIGDIRDRQRLVRAMENADIVFHAAALKHVPFCEYNPFEAVQTNVIGTKNVVDAALEMGVEKLIGVSTDKAVDPINTMGATKLLSEKIITNAPIGKKNVKFCCVRFGNVLDSSGSVIPIFKNQIKNNTTITITHNEMTRFFMSMPEAVNLVLKAAHDVVGGEIFILKMKALRIKDLAETLIEELAPKYGKKIEEFNHQVIGMRAGEKMHELLLTKQEAVHTTETDTMYILRNSLLAEHCAENVKPHSRTPVSMCSSSLTPHLKKNDIRTILKKSNII